MRAALAASPGINSQALHPSFFFSYLARGSNSSFCEPVTPVSVLRLSHLILGLVRRMLSGIRCVFRFLLEYILLSLFSTEWLGFCAVTLWGSRWLPGVSLYMALRRYFQTPMYFVGRSLFSRVGLVVTS